MWFLRQMIYLFKVLLKYIIIKAFFYLGRLIRFHLLSIYSEKFQIWKDWAFWNITRYKTTHIGEKK